VCDLKDEKLIKKNKPTRKLKHANSILETFEYFCQISSKSIDTISSYTVSKLGPFFETQCTHSLTRIWPESTVFICFVFSLFLPWLFRVVQCLLVGRVCIVKATWSFQLTDSVRSVRSCFCLCVWFSSSSACCEPVVTWPSQCPLLMWWC